MGDEDKAVAIMSVNGAALANRQHPGEALGGAVRELAKARGGRMGDVVMFMVPIGHGVGAQELVWEALGGNETGDAGGS